MHEQLVVALNTQIDKVYISRQLNSGNTEFSEHFKGMHEAPYKISGKGEIRFHAFVDLSSIELFVDGGKVAMTELVFPESGFESIQFLSNHESVSLKEGVIYRLKSVW